MAELDVEFYDNMKKFCTKGKTTRLKARKKFNPKKSDAVLNMKMPPFNVVTISGETKPISSFIETGRPTLICFFHISPDADFGPQEVEESGAGETDKPELTAKSFLKVLKDDAKAQATPGGYITLFVNMEKWVFGYKVQK